jgi:UDP-glucose-4-epimerase GalE
MSRILITGGAGYIGSHAAKGLARTGFEPVTLDDLSSGHRWAVQWGPLIEGDIADEQLVRDVILRYKIEAVMHFAAFASVAESMDQPRKYFQNNVRSTITLLDALLDCGVKHFVFSSSCATYGIPQHVPIAESHPQNPVNPYGESKLMIEKVLRRYTAAYGLKSVALRYFNAAGADPNGDLGEDHDPETHLLPRVILAALENEPVSVYGTDYPTSDGTAVRDYLHVSDIAEAHVLALKYLLDGNDSAEFNLGTGRGHSVLNVVRTVGRVCGREVAIRESKRRAGDPPELVADPSKARRTLNWIPRFSDLSEIVSTAWKWHTGRLSRVAAAGSAV